ncbi:flavin reductase family protein [Mycobacterium sp. CBMA293]|nr:MULTISPECIES: flavin reductase family protein [unclassified Mycolicibacterium]MUL45239.1 flavin reductase family protein [Mycolicibacterium sp. CBMA 360]MUL56759.1 flavin reductase family protein [Mycolicibacterium sp. CBMA 335]MUL69798.1 flavin reductase family protein [Mycolicibacterium sp. CBMA 311]MUL91846.1 flavin reductase family protein [Mycolicibacterium sp. CBMA 230]MUM05585.1 Asp/Glu/hydantoin racemase [Mycolicibacterium sp. CBMA 213]
MARDDAHYYQPDTGTGLPHDPFNAIVAPRPIGWISSVSADGIHNLAPYSFFNAFNYAPPLIGFASIGWKDTVANIESTGEFVWNLATRDLADKMNATSAPLPREIDEFDYGDLTPAPARRVRPARVLESPVNFECVLTQLIQLQTAQRRAVQTWLVIGEVVAVHIDRAHLKNGVYDTAAARPILRAGGQGDYAEIHSEEMFTMRRPST